MNTPSYIVASLQVSSWEQVNEENWRRPGAHHDVHSWPVADLIRRTSEPHHHAPPAVAVSRPRKPGFQGRGGNRRPDRVPMVSLAAPCRVGHPRKVELIRRVATMHDEQRMTFAAIAAEIGGKASRAHYLYRQVGKLSTGQAAGMAR